MSQPMLTAADLNNMFVSTADASRILGIPYATATLVLNKAKCTLVLIAGRAHYYRADVEKLAASGRLSEFYSASRMPSQPIGNSYGLPGR
jgi:hypothetical protein